MTDLTETTQNYLKQIFILVKKNGSARISDIATALDKSLSTVTGAVQRMNEDGLINYKPYERITLTDNGTRVAEEIFKNFSIIREFLVMIGVNVSIADIDACEMEHISEETITMIIRFVNFMKNDNNASSALELYQQGILDDEKNNLL